MGTNYSEDDYYVDAEKGMLNIGWYDVYGKAYSSEESIVNIKVRVKDVIEENVQLFTLNSNTELAGVDAHKLGGLGLSTAYVNTDNGGATPQERYGLSTTNYPNPFKDYTTIEYTLPEDGNVDVSVYDV